MMNTKWHNEDLTAYILGNLVEISNFQENVTNLDSINSIHKEKISKAISNKEKFVFYWTFNEKLKNKGNLCENLYIFVS